MSPCSQVRSRDWELSEVAVRQGGTARRLGRRGQVIVVDWSDIISLLGEFGQATDQLVAQMEDMKPADVARELHELSPQRRAEVASALDDQKLASALEELPEDEQVQLIQAMDNERAADILEEMDPDDAADLIGELSPEMAEELLGRMEPDEAKDVRRLLSYAEFTAGGMMTPEPVILAPDATVADALALVRQEQLTPALAAMVYVTRPPLETPTGRLVGGVHIQRLLREPPSLLVASLIDHDLQPIADQASLHAVSRYFATYNLVNAPVIDKDNRLIGAITVDDVLDHVLPEDWRGTQLDASDVPEDQTEAGLDIAVSAAASNPNDGNRRPATRTRGVTDGSSITGFRPGDRDAADTGSERLNTPGRRRRSALPSIKLDRDAFGKFAEEFARFMGTAKFLAYMTAFIIIWLVLNSTGLLGSIWDPYPYILLTLMLSLQASYAAPLILLAQNRQEARDRVGLDLDRSQSAQSRADMDFLAREIASLRMSVGEMATRDFLRSELRNELAIDPGRAGRGRAPTTGTAPNTARPPARVARRERGHTAGADYAGGMP